MANKKYKHRKLKKGEICTPRRRFKEIKKKSQKRGIEWKLTFEEYSNLIIAACYYCKNQLGPPSKRGSGLDRLDSNKGYELDNVVSCCYVCNTMKHIHLTPEETKAAVKAVIKIRKKNNK